MVSRSLLAITLVLCSAGSIFSTQAAIAVTPLNRATVQKVQNDVRLFLKNQEPKKAARSDVMTPGDALRTAQRAMAELRFNDNSLARVGEQAIFRFEPNTRDFNLQRGTVLLLIKPGQGRTRVRTPNAAAGIRGSALFVRYIPDSNVTLVGALTDSDIEITNEAGQRVVLKSSQIGYVHNNSIGVVDFDQRVFLQTSPMFQDLDWNEAPAEVKAEIELALSKQNSTSAKYQNTPGWTQLAENRQAAGHSSQPLTTSATVNHPASVINRPDYDLYPTRPDSGAQPLPATAIAPTSPAIPGSPAQSIPARPQPVGAPLPPVETPVRPTPPVVETPPIVETPVRPTPPVVETPPVVVTPPVVETPVRPTPPVVETPVLQTPVGNAPPANQPFPTPPPFPAGPPASPVAPISNVPPLDLPPGQPPAGNPSRPSPNASPAATSDILPGQVP